MLIKKGKQFKLQTINNYKINYGTVDNETPKTMYINISGWAELIDKEPQNYSLIINKLNKQIKQYLYDTLDNKLFNINRTIVDFDLKESGMSPNRRSYMNCEITFFKLNNFKIQNTIIVKEINTIVDNVINDVFETNKSFKFFKTKK